MNFKLQEFNTDVVVSRIANIHYFEFDNNYFTTEDSHNFCELLYVDKGKIRVNSENYSGDLSDEQIIIHRPNEKHSLVCEEGVCSNVIIIGFECMSELLSSFSHTPIKLQPGHKKQLADVMIEGMNAYAPPYDIPNSSEMKKRTPANFGSEQMLKINLEAFLISIIRYYIQNKSDQTDDLIMESKFSDVHKYISEHYTEKVSLDNICFLFGTNKTSLCKMFKKEHGITISDYVTKLRIKNAKAMLREGGISVTEVSEKLGFSSIHYFSRVFKKSIGLTPVEYQKMIKSKLSL